MRDSVKVGLALGGGYARGLAHIGVLEVLEREGIPVDMIAGTSIGALVGALYAIERDAALLKNQAMQLDSRGLASLVDLTLPKSGFIRGKRVTSLLRRFIGDAQFKDLSTPLFCVATDIITGEEIVINQGSVLEAVRASISIPIIFTVAKSNGRYLVDGGLVNPVPVSVLRKMGADYIIAVDVTPNRTERAAYLRKQIEAKEPGIFQVMVQSIYITTYLTARTVSEGADALVHPQLAQIGPGEFHRARECILQGELAAVDSLTNIKKQLKTAGIPLKR
ncbi:MAG: patatin-like phospholipase family protein [Dehalococcoidales bacterium]|nr:patatin-like phospholipase family protein [Dehalococcoidales bacterium]